MSVVDELFVFVPGMDPAGGPNEVVEFEVWFPGDVADGKKMYASAPSAMITRLPKKRYIRFIEGSLTCHQRPQAAAVLRQGLQFVPLLDNLHA